MGLVVLGLVAGGIGYYAAILHIILHSLVKSGFFFQYNQLYRVFQSKSILYMGNYFKYHPAGALVLLLGFFSAAAMPPSGMFISEFLIFRSLFEARYFLLLIAVLVLLTLIIWSFGKNIFKIVFTPLQEFDEQQVPVSYSWECLSQFILMAIAIYLGFNPPEAFADLIRESVSLLP